MRSTRSIGGRGFWLIVGMAAAITVTALVLLGPPSRGERAGVALAPARPGVRPLRVAPAFSMPGVVGSDALDRAMDRLATYRPEALSGLLHLVRLFGAETPLRAPGVPPHTDPLDFALDYDRSRALFHGAATLIDTRDGVRCRVAARALTASRQGEKESHEDQLLAVLAELGVPLDRRLSTEGGDNAVGRLLDDALAKFDLDQPEVEWSALAFALYLPPRRSWVDRFGTRVTFDELTTRLIALPPKRRACGGTHLLYTLAVIGRVDEQVPILSDRVRGDLKSHLGRAAAALARDQADDGSWGLSWDRPGDRTGTATDRVLATGHSIEWLMMLPAELRPGRDCFQRAAGWLERQLLTCPDEEIAKNYCPYSHAGRVLLLLSAPGGTADRSKVGAADGRPSEVGGVGTGSPARLLFGSLDVGRSFR